MSTTRDKKEALNPVQKRGIFVLDIDEMIATVVSDELNESPFLEWFDERNLAMDLEIITEHKIYNFEHILLPGAPEFFRFIKQLPIDFCFFSAGLEERNGLFAQEFYKRAFNEKFQESFTVNNCNFKVFSRQHLDIIDGQFKKNLNTVLKEVPGSLESTILIDNSMSNLIDSQVPNGLITYTADAHILKQAFEMRQESQEREDALFSANQLFYVTGLLSKLLSLEGSLSNNLFHLQYKITDHTCELNTDLYRDKSLYLEGFKILNGFNVEKNLSFFGLDANNFFGLDINLSNTPAIIQPMSTTLNMTKNLIEESKSTEEERQIKKPKVASPPKTKQTTREAKASLSNVNTLFNTSSKKKKQLNRKSKLASKKSSGSPATPKS